MEELAEQYTRPRALEFNVGKGSAKNDTGRYNIIICDNK